MKWSKRVLELTIKTGDSGRKLKEQVYLKTRVPIERQKILTSKKKGTISWKGSLIDDFIFTVDDFSRPLVVTLIGSAEAVDKAPSERTKFVEDMTDEQKREIDEATEKAALENATGMIPALQFPPHLRDDGKQEIYQYNRMVTGLPQRSIEDLLKQKSFNLLGKVAMTLGMELRRAYVNDMATLNDGSLVSALDDGHIQIWKHGQLQHDLIHGGGDGGVDSVLAISSTNGNGNIAFCSSGKGCFRLWTHNGKEVLALPVPVPESSPQSLVQITVPNNKGSNPICLAACFKISYQYNPNRFRLVPQDQDGRRRRQLAEAQEAAKARMMEHMARSIEIIYESPRNEGSNQHAVAPLQSHLLTVEDETASPITCLAAFTVGDNNSESFLISGDLTGGLRLWKPQLVEANGIKKVDFVQEFFLRLIPSGGSSCSIVCMESLGDGRHLAVSTTTTTMTRNSAVGTSIPVPLSKAVYILDIDKYGSVEVVRVLNGHKDFVHCMCALPNGSLMTGGSKLDATLQLWNASQISSNEDQEYLSESLIQNQSSQTLSDVGYVFGLIVLKDNKAGSSEFGVAAARYNTVKIVL
jgi:WD40 repeat protein